MTNVVDAEIVDAEIMDAEIVDAVDEVNLPTLTTDQAAILRVAQRVELHYKDGGAYILAGVTGEGGALSQRQQRLFPVGEDGKRSPVVIRVNGEAVGHRANGSVGWRETNAPKLAADHVIEAADGDEHWQGMAWTLREGDVLTLVWVADRNTPEVRAAGLHVDEVHLVVERERGGTSFLVAYRVAGKTGRMVRRTGK